MQFYIVTIEGLNLQSFRVFTSEDKAIEFKDKLNAEWGADRYSVTKLYSTPPPHKELSNTEESDCYGCRKTCRSCLPYFEDSSTAPPPRKELSDEEIITAIQHIDPSGYINDLDDDYNWREYSTAIARAVLKVAG